MSYLFWFVSTHIYSIYLPLAMLKTFNYFQTPTLFPVFVLIIYFRFSTLLIYEMQRTQQSTMFWETCFFNTFHYQPLAVVTERLQLKSLKIIRSLNRVHWLLQTPLYLRFWYVNVTLLVTPTCCSYEKLHVTANSSILEILMRKCYISCHSHVLFLWKLTFYGELLPGAVELETYFWKLSFSMIYFIQYVYIVCSTKNLCVSQMWRAVFCMKKSRRSGFVN